MFYIPGSYRLVVVSMGSELVDTDDEYEYRASYHEGRLVPSKPGASADPKPSAGNDGTTIIVSCISSRN